MNKMYESAVETYFEKRVKDDLSGIALKLEVKGRRGWPDRIALLPVGVTFYVELKAPGGKPSRMQIQRRLEIEGLNQPYAMLSSIVEIDIWVAKVQASTAAAAAEVRQGETIQ